MVRNRRLLIALGATALLLGVLAGAGVAGAASGRPLAAQLTGAEEVPGPGDADGSGNAFVTLNRKTGVVCWEISVANITLPAIAAHIHRGPAGVAGPVVVSLSPPVANGISTGCVSADASLIKELRQDPAGFYVNVHTTDFPAGAVRGQLTK